MIEDRKHLESIIADWMAAPFEPEDWQRRNASDLADAIADAGLIDNEVDNRPAPCGAYSNGTDGWCCAATGPHDEHRNAAGDVTWGDA